MFVFRGHGLARTRQDTDRAAGMTAINTNSLRIVNSKLLNGATLVSPPLLTSQAAAVLQCGRKGGRLFIWATGIPGTCY